jgi:signal transduction histidine kinase/ActR/RegA family two-component response regulator
MALGFEVHDPQKLAAEEIIVEDDSGEPFGLWIIDCETKEIAWMLMDESSKEKIGSRSSNCIDHFLVGLCHPNDLVVLREALSHMDSPVPVRLTVECRLRFGSVNYDWFHVIVVRKRIRYMALLAVSIREHKARISMLRELDGMITLGLNSGRVVTWHFMDTYQALKIRTLDPSGPFLLNWNTINFTVVPEFLPEFTRKIKEALDKRITFSTQVPIFYEKPRWFAVRVIPSATPGQLIGIDVDITAQKEMEQEMQDQKKKAEFALSAKTTFLANMSHEVRTPLNGMYGLLEILQTTDVTPEIAGMLAVLSDAFQKLLDVLNDTLDLARIEQKRMSTITVPFSPIEIVTDLLRAHTRQIQAGISIGLKTDPNSPVAFSGDPYIFGRIANNLISNACKFTNAGKVRVSLWSDDDGLRLRVRDTGIGISDEIQKTLFHIFQLGDATATRQYGGMGVGLALVSRMLELVHGKLEFQSQLGVGTTFSLVFPFEAAVSRSLPVHPDSKMYSVVYLYTCPCLLKQLHKHGSFFGVSVHETLDIPDDEEILGIVCGMDQLEAVRNSPVHCANVVLLSKVKVEEEGCETMLFPIAADTIFHRFFARTPKAVAVEVLPYADASVLAVEDARPGQLVLQKIFERIGCKFTMAGSGEEALDIMQKQKFDIILMDHDLPGMSGPDAVEIIRQGSDAPIVAMTASTERDDIKRFAARRIIYFLEKPISVAKVKAVLERALAGRALIAHQ